MEFFIVWAVVAVFACISCLSFAGAAYFDRDRRAVRQALTWALVALVWPVAGPVLLVYGIYKMFVFAFVSQ